MTFLDRPHKVLLDQATIQQRVKELGEQITQDYRGSDPAPVVVGILKGSTVFMSDLIRSIDLPLTIDYISVSSYGHNMKSTGVVRLLYDLTTSIEGKDVLVVEDIIDTGLTLQYLVENLTTRHPSSIKICTLLDKKESRQAGISITIDYSGFVIPNEFVVGYGLDFAEKYRNLPDIVSISE